MGTVDDSLADLPEPDRGCLQHVIDIARAVAPEAVEGISYGMPALKFEGKPLVGVVRAAKHLSAFPFSPAVFDAVARRLEGYFLSKGTIRFTPEHPLPDDVLEDIVRLRRAEIPLPSMAMSGPGSFLRVATAFAASPWSSVEFFQGSGSVSVLEATYFRMLSRTSVKGLSF
ncbi:hypothetical protein DAD99_04095 [Pseudarthrobacter sp. AB1]|nr:hypothetical protein [Pseudarthrobacter sp. AB1]